MPQLLTHVTHPQYMWMCYICWEGALEHDVMLKNWGNFGLGGYKMGLKKDLNVQTQHKTQPQHTTQHTQQPAQATASPWVEQWHH